MADNTETPERPADIPDGFIDFEINSGFANHIGPLYWRPAKDSVEMGFKVLDHHLNPGGICHGGLMMTVADMVVGFAVCWQTRFLNFPPSINNTFDFIGIGFHGDWLETKTEVIKFTKRMGFAQGVILGPNGPVLRYNGILKIPSDSDPRFKSDYFSSRMQKLYDTYLD